MIRSSREWSGPVWVYLVIGLLVVAVLAPIVIAIAKLPGMVRENVEEFKSRTRIGDPLDPKTRRKLLIGRWASLAGSILLLLLLAYHIYLFTTPPQYGKQLLNWPLFGDAYEAFGKWGVIGFEAAVCAACFFEAVRSHLLVRKDAAHHAVFDD